ncbi:MAG: hypothetical protein QM820_27490 [Minicystis sp.]
MSAARSVKVFLGGEGPNELGSRFGHRAYQSDERPGVLHTLLARVQPTGWKVGGARDWKSIRKFRAGRADHEDTHNVLGLALDAREAGCEVLAFSRDLDKDAARENAIREGIRRAAEAWGSAPEIIGGVAKPTVEGWILALLGERGTEQLSPKRAAQVLAEKGVPAKDGAAMVRAVEDADLAKLPDDATSLAAWIARAEAVLSPLVASRRGEP